MSRAQEINFTHAPNRKLDDIEGGRGAFWKRVALAESGGVQFLHDREFITHTREDARQAKQRGLSVLVRARGEVHGEVVDTLAAMQEFGLRKDASGRITEKAVADTIIVGGNEPPTVMLWLWLWYLEAQADQCLGPAHEAGMRLCAPSLHGTAEPLPQPPKGTDWKDERLPEMVRLAARFYEVLGKYDDIAVHAYGEHVFTGHQERIERWAEAFPGKGIHVAEAAIAARDLISLPALPAHYELSEFIKAERTAQAIKDAAKRGEIRSFCRYIDSGSTPEWGTFTEMGKYDPDGIRSYHLSDRALEWLAGSIRDV